MEVLEQKQLSFNPTVSSHGYGDARILFLSGWPLKEDLNTGLALSGHNEITINSFLKEYGMNLNQCYRACFIREKMEYSGTNPFKQRHALSLIDTAKYEKMLFDEINDIKPNIIVPLDDVALSVVFPHVNSMSKPKGRKYWIYCYRGSILPLRQDWQSLIDVNTTIRLIPTLGPQLIYNDWQAKAYVSIDYKKIVQWKEARSRIEDYGVVSVIRNASHLETYFERSFKENDGFMTFDIETWGGFITCISFCFNGYEAVSVPLTDTAVPIGERVFLWRLISKALANPIAKCGQNVKFDWTILERHGFEINNVLHDTMLKAGLIYPELAKGLDFLTSLYTEIPYYKDEGKEYNPKLHTRDRLYLYNAKDSLATHIVNKFQEDDMDTLGVKELYYSEIAPLILIYKDIDRTGILVDDSRRSELLNKYETMQNSNLSILRGMVNDGKFNPNSSQQAGRIIYDEIKYPKRTKINEDGKKSYKTDKDTLDDLLIHHGESNKSGRFGYNVVSRIIACRKISRVIDYLSTAIHPDGRWRASSNLAGTETGRSSSSKTIDEEILSEELIKKKHKLTRRLGRSLQTISKHGFQLDEEVFDDMESAKIAQDLRSIFVPTPGFVFVEGDGNGAEARVVFVLAEDYENLAAMDQKPKLHAKMAAAIFEVDVSQIKKNEFGEWEPMVPKIGMSYYDLGKRAQHAANYDMRDFRLSQMTHLPLKESSKILTRVHELRPKIRSVFHQEVSNFVREKRFLATPFLRRRDFFGRIDESFFKQSYAQIPQSTVSDLTKFTMRRVINVLPGYQTDYRFLTEQHDGILAEVREERKFEYAKVLKAQYEREIDFLVGSLPRDFRLIIPCEISMSSSNWQELKEVEF